MFSYHAIIILTIPAASNTRIIFSRKKIGIKSLRFSLWTIMIWNSSGQSVKKSVVFTKECDYPGSNHIPSTFRLVPDVELYSADSILNMFSGLLTDEIIEVVGMTNKGIYILNKTC
jgi:hypothetical protein